MSVIPFKEVDERAHKFFHRCYVGEAQGEEGTAYKMFIENDHEGLVSTKTFSFKYSRDYCSYCGHVAYSIQSNIPRGDYSATGKTCFCKGAMDEVEFQQNLEQLEMKHKQEIRDLKKTAPEVDESLMKNLVVKIVGKMDDYDIQRLMKEVK